MGMFGDLGKVAKEEFGALIAHRYDAWMNMITGLGTARDKRTGAHFTPDAFLDPQALENLYNGDDMAAKAVESLPDDALKKGFDLTSGDADDASDAKEEADGVKALLEELGAEDKIGEAATWGRLYGAGGVLLGVTDGKKPTEELIDDDVVSLDFLTTLDLRDLFVEAYYPDPLRANYGEPMIYRVQPVSGTSALTSALTQYVHASRVVMFRGVRTGRRTRIQRQGWNLSVLQRVYEILRDANANWASTSHLMTDSNLAILKIKNFLAMIAAKDTADFQTRMEMLDMSKSVARAYVCDADTEDYERKPTSFAGYPDILDRTWQRLAAATGMPVTRLMGMSPAGMNATGESDERNWANSVEAYQRKELKKPTERIARLAARTLDVSEPEAISVCFPPFRQLTPTEEATRRLSVAQTDQIYILQGVWLAEEVATARVKGGQYSADPPIVDLALRERVLTKQLKAYEANAGKEQSGTNANGTAGGQANDTTTGGGDVVPGSADDPGTTISE